MILFLFAALAHEAPVQDIHLSESIPLFVDLGLDSGWVPNTGSMSVRLELVANGNAIVDETGQARLSWDDTEELRFQIEGGEGQGRIALDSALETLVSIRFDVYGYHRGFHRHIGHRQDAGYSLYGRGLGRTSGGSNQSNLRTSPALLCSTPCLSLRLLPAQQH